MSTEKRHYEADRWLSQAHSDVEAAELSARGGSFEWSCFQAQQAAEKALKAYWLAGGHDPWGHSLLRLIREHPEEAPARTLQRFAEYASTLDQYYIPTRYPNGLPDLTPHEVYTEKQATAAISSAREIITGISELLMKL